MYKILEKTSEFVLIKMDLKTFKNVEKDIKNITRRPSVLNSKLVGKLNY